MMPPPNVTGSLHMGHALTFTLQDVLIRHKRMAGYDALWQPGTDHAGIATQSVVERTLRQEGDRRTTSAARPFSSGSGSGRTKSGGTISRQLRQLGASPATGSASASPWTPSCRRRCARCSSSCTARG